MSSKSPYSQYEQSDSQTRRRSTSPREPTSSQTYAKLKDQRSNMRDDQDRETRRNSRERSPGSDKNSDSYYSDDYDNTTYGSERSPTPSSKSISPPRKADYKVRSVTPVHNRGIKKAGSKLSSSKRGPRWGFRSQSLNKESPPKDIDMVTKRVLSARLLKINELRNEVAELQLKLDEHQKENKTLKRLQFRQEKALNKFEDTENEISQLISRHNNEVRILRERLRKSQERERNIEKKLKETEDELYRTNVALKKLKQLSENRNLAEREELTRKTELMETRLDERERRVKELEKNIELIQGSFQRQLVSEKKKAHDAQEENRLLKEELQRLLQKLKDKERELDAKNIYAYRLLKPSPKKDAEIMPRKKGVNPGISKCVQTADSHSSLDSTFPEPPPPILIDERNESLQDVLELEQDNLAKQIREEAERLQKEKELAERRLHLEEKLRKEKDQKILEDKAKRLREEWEKEEMERKRKEEIKRKEEEDKRTYEDNINRTEEERLRKELLLAKMFAIDRENQDPFYSESTKPPAVSPLVTTTDTADTKHKSYVFSDATEKLFNGLPVGGQERDVKIRRNESTYDTNGDLTFGSYTPSFGKGRSSAGSQKKDVSEDPIITSTKLEIKKEKRSHLMEQLFGSSSTPALPSISKTNDQTPLPWEQSSKPKGKNDVPSAGDGKTLISSRHRSHPAPGRTIVKAVDSIEDDIEEVAL